jgi:hypothetical protein
MTALVARLRWHDSERGASLILALAMIMIVSVAITGILGYAATSVHTIGVVRDQRSVVYAADGATQTAIQTVKSDATAGATTAPCGSVGYPAVGSQPAATAACSVTTARGAGLPGTNEPGYAMWAGAGGVSAANTGTLQVGGPVSSNATIASSGTVDASGYTVQATGACTGTITVSTASDKTCSSGVAYADPGYPSQTVSLTTTNPAPTCSVLSGVVQFSPGMYTNATMLESPVYGTCTPGYLYFKPGVYYFDFDAAYGDSAWNVAANQKVVGGQVKGWDPAVASSRPPAPGGGGSKACKTEADGGTDGVQFVFGGASQLNVTAAGATMELCADPTPTGTTQQVAIYGQTTGTTPTPLTVTREATSLVAGSSPAWGTTVNALPIAPSTTSIDGKFATVTVNSTTAATLTLNGFAGPPAGSSNVTFQVKATHKEGTPANISTLTAQISTCAAIPLTKSSTLHLDQLPTPTPLACPAAATAATFPVTFSALAVAGKTSSESLDGIQVSMTYTPPALRMQSGCATQQPSPCPTLTAGTGATFVVWGTVYTPLGYVLADGSTYEFRRGVVARAVQTTGTPGTNGVGFCLGYGTPCVGPSRVLLFTATVNSATKLRALVKYFDAPSVGRRVEVLSWNVVR